jgi:hypothetical protein
MASNLLKIPQIANPQIHWLIMQSQIFKFLRCASLQIANPQIFTINPQIANLQISTIYCTLHNAQSFLKTVLKVVDLTQLFCTNLNVTLYICEICLQTSYLMMKTDLYVPLVRTNFIER